MEIYGCLGSIADFFKWSGYHINSFEYYDKFFQLSDDPAGTETDLPSSFDIEFRDVWFKYPGTDRYSFLKGLNENRRRRKSVHRRAKTARASRR